MIRVQNKEDEGERKDTPEACERQQKSLGGWEHVCKTDVNEDRKHVPKAAIMIFKNKRRLPGSPDKEAEGRKRLYPSFHHLRGTHRGWAPPTWKHLGLPRKGRERRLLRDSGNVDSDNSGECAYQSH